MGIVENVKIVENFHLEHHIVQQEQVSFSDILFPCHI